MLFQRDALSLLSSNILGRLGHAYLSFGADVYRSSLQIASGYMLRAVEQTLRVGIDPADPKDLLDSFIVGLRNYCVEMVTVGPFAFERLSANLDAEFAEPRLKVRLVKDKPVLLPARIADASQGWAVYFVSADDAQRHLGKHADHFTVVDVGNKRTAVAVFGVDYRETDLGTYSEIGVAFSVRPRGDVSEVPGMLFLSLTVNQEFTLHAAETIWGYHKTLAPDLAVVYHDTRVAFCVDARDVTALSASFPRFGSGRSTGVPSYAYSSIRNARQQAQPCKAMFSRSGSDEGFQVGGNVKLTLGDGTQENCVCRLDRHDTQRGAGQACVCLILRELGLSQRLPAANGWSEHMSGALHGPVPCSVDRSPT